MKAMARIFLSYAREDAEKVESLYHKLSDAGFKPWMDKKDILPGEQRKSRIPQAIRRSDFFLACLSANSVGKRGWIQKQIKDALDIWQEKLESDIYLIPVRLEDCEVPERLRDFQWVNLFEEDGWARLVQAIQVGMERRAGAPVDEESSPGTEMATPEEGPGRVREAVGPGTPAHLPDFTPEQIADLIRKISPDIIAQLQASGALVNPEQVRALEQALEKAPQVDRVLTPASTEVSIGGDATGSVVVSTASGDVHLNLAERRAIPQALPHIPDDDLRALLALLGLAVSEDLAPGPDPAALLQDHLEKLAGRLERERPWARGLRGYVPLATHLNQSFSLRTLPRGDLGPGRHFEERARFDDLAQAVQQAADEDGQPLHCFVLLGEPGAGKSTALRKLALQAVRARLADPAAPFPLFVRLSEHRTGSPAEFLAAEWQRTYGDEAWPQVLHPSSGRPPLRVWLFADGLNEMSPDGYHDRVAAWSRFLHDELPLDNRALVACRVADYGNALALPRLEIQPLDPERIQTFLHNYLPDRAADLWRDLLADRQRHGDEHSLYGLAANPFWLTMIVAVYRAWGLLEGHADLIEHFVDEWLRYEAKRPGSRARSPEEAEAFKQTVARLAYPLLERGQNVPQPLGDVRAWLPEQVDVEGEPVPTPPDDTLSLAGAVNLVVVEGERPGARTVRFYHQLLLEHFAGREMARRFQVGADQSARWRIPWQNWQFVDSEWDPLPPPPTTGWEEATALAAACLAYPDPRQAEALARAVLAHHPPLAARCLLEAGLVPPEGVKAITARLLAIIGGQTSPGLQPDQALCLRRACGLALGHLGDPRILAGESRTPDGVRFTQPQWSRVIPAGPFLMGSDRDEEGAYDHEYSAATGFQRHQVDIPYEYRIGLYPVTNAEYRCFIDDGGYEKEGYWTTEAARHWLRGQADLEPVLRWWRWVAEVVRRDPDLPDRYLQEKRLRPQDAEAWKWAAAADGEELAAGVRQYEGQTEAPRAPNFWDDRAYNNASQPVVGVCWHEAMAYCAWLTEQMSKSANQHPPADGGRVGEGSPVGWKARPPLSVGRRLGCLPMQFAGRPGADHHPGGHLSRWNQPLRCAGHGRQRVGVDAQFVGTRKGAASLRVSLRFWRRPRG
jgi:hypothetical protein